MIKWHLNRVMADKRVKGKALAEKLGVHPNTVYRLRNARTMPSLDGEFLSELCRLLDCRLWDLIEESPSQSRTPT